MASHSQRTVIVTAAVDRFHAKGYHATGVNDIAVAAGVPRGSFYNHFASKEELAAIVLQQYGQTRRLEELSDPAVAPLERLRRYFEFLRDEQVEHHFTRGCLFGNFGSEMADHSEVLRGGVEHCLGRWRAALTEVLAEAVRSGAVRAGLDPEAAALFILCAWEGALVAARCGRSDEAFSTFFRVVFGSLLQPGQDNAPL
ncbi:TetR/AcrR family transcriptional regulator [Streptomyces sp. JH14]|uniref:TetR/AcrR family transcriptional regulator n=1 Tax=Streptomyces sp. JH14 TaxID=2793630 RepID=UPI0023F676C2|nr:TetR/AcrR family transcriptional regulator [Streptomyces sp. JH14]MDF6045947.1 TetR/AcrR family transcriptional regulator [Streptomyces sp. JH14]